MTAMDRAKPESGRQPVEQGGDCPVSGHWTLRVTHPQIHPWTGTESRSLNTILLWEIK